jgi:protein-S-isoprenylcysteine O-methyltransferase Ste14
MVGADAQKYFVLRARRGLITDGFFARTRNPNYLGEMMIYASFAIVAGHWLPWLVLAWVWLGVFVPNMLRKDASMSRYPEWSDYKARSGLLLPRLG